MMGNNMWFYVVWTAIVVVVLALLYGYSGWRLLSPAELPLAFKVGFWSVIVLAALALIYPFVMRGMGKGPPLIVPISWVGYFLFGFFSILFVLLVGRDVALLLAGGLKKVWLAIRSSGVDSVGETAADPERRRWMLNVLNVGVLGAAGSLTGYGVYLARRTPDVVKVDVPIKGLPEELDGFSIAQFSDLHVSSTIRRGFVEAVVSRINALKPDMIAFTGDLVDGSVEALKEHVAPLGRLSAPHGSFFVTGNHEYYSGAEEWVAEVERLGFQALINRHKVLRHKKAGLVVAGVTDYRAGRMVKGHETDPEKALSRAPENLPRLMLAHQPKSVFKVSKLKVDLQLSGHTHGGQYFPWTLMIPLFEPLSAGLYKVGDGRLYVNRGTGYWGPPLRGGMPSEITLLRLVREEVS